MADKKIIAVIGSTGSQGGGLVRAILSDPNGGFAARRSHPRSEQRQGESTCCAAARKLCRPTSTMWKA